MAAAKGSCGWIEWVLGSGERRTAVSQLSGEGAVGGGRRGAGSASASAAEEDLWRVGGVNAARARAASRLPGYAVNGGHGPG
jgi:hypothetical protein